MGRVLEQPAGEGARDEAEKAAAVCDALSATDEVADTLSRIAESTASPTSAEFRLQCANELAAAINVLNEAARRVVQALIVG